MTTRSQYVARHVIEQQLSDITLDEHGTPDRKLPDCPLCGEDELYGWRRKGDRYHGFKCYRCSYQFTVDAPRPQPAASEPPQTVRIPLEQVVTVAIAAVAEQQMRDMVLSVLIARAGGAITLSDDELRMMHGHGVKVAIEEGSGGVTVSCTRCHGDHPVGYA